MSVFSKIYEDIRNEIVQHEDYQNLSTEHFLTCIFYSTVIASFSYEGDTPDFIRQVPSYIEECFFMSSKVGFFVHEGKPYITPCYPNGVLLDNGMYSHYTCIFRNGKQVIIPIEDIEICENNSLGVPSRVLVDEILTKCVNSLRAVDMSLERASMPALTITDNRTADLIANAIRDSLSHSKPYALIENSAIKGDAVHKYDLFDNRAQDVIALWDIFVRYKNLFFSSWGVNNVEIAKNERLTQAEGESNTEIIRYALFYDLYEHRVDWFKRIADHFGYNITVVINRNVDTVTEITMTTEEKQEMKKMLIAPYLNQNNNNNEKEGEGNDEDTAEDEDR